MIFAMLGRPQLLFEMSIFSGVCVIFLTVYGITSRVHFTETVYNRDEGEQGNANVLCRSNQGHTYPCDRKDKSKFIYQAIEMLKTAQHEIQSFHDSKTIHNAIQTLVSLVPVNDESNTGFQSWSLINNNDKLCPEEHIHVDSNTEWSYFKQSAQCKEVNRKYIEDHVTILLNFATFGPIDSADIQRVVEGVFELFPNVSVVLAVQNCHMAKLCNFTEMDNVKIFIVQHREKPGKIWNHMTNTVKTPYVLIGRDVVDFDADARLERLLIEMQLLNMTIIGEYQRFE